MKHNSEYIMHEQVQNLIPSIMEYDVTFEHHSKNAPLHLMAIGVLASVYIIAMAFSG